jgi:hypothetical protein
MKTNEIALIDLVKQLGFENHKALSNGIRDIIKSKEDFEKRFIVNNKEKNPEKIIVTEEARILVDNLCILKPYKSFFENAPKGSAHECPAYRQLKSPKGWKLKDRSKKVKTNLELKKKGIEEALIQLSKVTAVLCSDDPIGITTDSLREMIEKACPLSEVVDFSKSFEIAAWNELSTFNSSDSFTQRLLRNYKSPDNGERI